MVLLLLRGSRFKVIFITTLLFCAILLYYIQQNHYQIRNALSYATRPLWDKADGPEEVISHYYAEGMKFDAHTCKLHGWDSRQDQANLKVFDAVLFSTELDLLEIRMNELDGIVDKFFIVESNATFTGNPKEAYFANNRGRFKKFEEKIVYTLIPGSVLRDGQSPWDVESYTRDVMTHLIRDHVREHPSGTAPLVLMSDLDEIPSRHTLQLLKACDFGPSIHLQLRNFLYSFEWYLGPSSWRASVHLWRPNSYYRHSKSGERALADAGWHCSYCFRTLGEYVTKMKGFSHADRIGGHPELLEVRRIQEVICKGTDIFGMLPEAYSYLDLFHQLNLEPYKSAVDLPLYLLENSERFSFLLPGGCVRHE
ncbi:glycosyltransferase family 17 protein [Pluteus cervinus]|uniref:Glycosyltransferase family 17 protein n=1 Tax=Pluteus cervinus TaxID=181527 RepID=A0ACD3B7G8_9AGAR|nr:glycosyltransferase family 17 protein [Pluteus cervinus]